jgi:large subunit ribosomal protein L19e
MQLAKKKNLAANVLGVGKGRVIFAFESLNEIKEAITRQDILDLFRSGAIRIKDLNGRRKNEKRRNRRRTGKIKKKINNTKTEYVIMTRKLRKYSKFLLKTKKLDNGKYKDIRKMIKVKKFKSKRHLNEFISEI